MFEVDVPRYFCLDLVPSMPDNKSIKRTAASVKRSPTSFQLMKKLKLTQKEIEYEELLSDFVFQI